MHHLDPIAQRIHDQADNRGTVEVEAVAAAAVIHVVASRRLGRTGQAVVGNVVDAAKTNARTELASLAAMVVNDIQDDLDSRFVKLPHQGFELGHLATRCALRAIGGFRREECDGVIAPIIRQAPLEEKVVDDIFVNG